MHVFSTTYHTGKLFASKTQWWETFLCVWQQNRYVCDPRVAYIAWESRCETFWRCRGHVSWIITYAIQLLNAPELHETAYNLLQHTGHHELMFLLNKIYITAYRLDR